MSSGEQIKPVGAALDKPSGSTEQSEAPKLSEAAVQAYLGFSNPDDVPNLKKRIEGVNGHVRIIVHPFFSKDRKESPGKENRAESYTNARRVIDTVLTRDSSSPVFLFEDGDKSTFSEIPEGSPKTSLITLPTYGEIGIPFVEGIGVNDPEWRGGFMTFISRKSEEDPERARMIFNRILNKSFDHLSQVFSQLGVKSITASGMYLGVNTEGEAFLEGCLGEFIRELRKRNFKVDISPKFGSYSGDSAETRAEIQKAGVPIKQTGENAIES